MDRNTAQNMLNRMKEVLAAEFPEYTAKFAKTHYDSAGEISFKFDLIDNAKAEALANRDNNVGLAKNKVHPQAIGMEFEHKGETFVVQSVKTRKQKYCVVAKGETKTLRFPASYINEIAKTQFGTSVRYVGNTAILDGRN